MQQSFSNLKEIEKICKLEKHDENFESSFNSSTLDRRKPTKAESYSHKTPVKTTSKGTKLTLKMGKTNECYQFSPSSSKIDEVNGEESSKKKAKKAEVIDFHPKDINKMLDMDEMSAAESTSILLRKQVSDFDVEVNKKKSMVVKTKDH